MGKIKRKYTLGEEIFSSVSHGVGACLSIAGTVVLLVFSVIYGNALAVVSSSIYGASLIILYTMSTLYHSFTNERVKHFFQIMDHNPITLYILGGVTGWILFSVVWVASIIGITLNSINMEKAKIPSLVCYIATGWVIIFAIKPLIAKVPFLSAFFLVLGGVIYTVGIVFYVIKKVKYFHPIWHIFTVLGSAFHYFSILIAIIKM